MPSSDQRTSVQLEQKGKVVPEPAKLFYVFVQGLLVENDLRFATPVEDLAIAICGRVKLLQVVCKTCVDVRRALERDDKFGAISIDRYCRSWSFWSRW